ncbi:MAG: hypothetical protein BWY97_00064 [Tenericutes bacterium ADurb.BinA124]|nr:MAG: hypothetical protein BWY97_00064 [Tenericutes bacterium ADurb.BinA124]
MNKTIEDVANEYVTQDTRYTALPYALLVIEEDFVRNDDEGDIVGIVSPCYDNVYAYDSLRDKRIFEIAIDGLDESSEEDKNIIEEIKKDFLKIELLDDLEEFWHKYIDDDAKVYMFSSYYTYKGRQMFLTESSAKAYIKANEDNLQNPKTYGIHISQNRDMELVIQDLMKKATAPFDEWNPEAQRYYKHNVLLGLEQANKPEVALLEKYREFVKSIQRISKVCCSDTEGFKEIVDLTPSANDKEFVFVGNAKLFNEIKKMEKEL